MNERFTRIADRVSETIGQWWVTAISIVVVLLWLASGPFFHFSDTWQLMINTPTTILEMWLGFLIAAAANRVERNNRLLQDQQFKIIQHIDATAAQEEQEIAASEQELLQEDKRMLEIMQHLDRQDALILQIVQHLEVRKR